MSELTPREIVSELDKFIIGQKEAKKAVAIALRNRWRRMQVNKDLRSEIVPKNILMIGPTGVGKTEIARRLAKLAYAPFVKVEATKYTEVGYVGKDVESIIRELAEVSMKMVKEEAFKGNKTKAEDAAEECCPGFDLGKWEEYSDIVFFSKSVGTVVALSYAAEHGLGAAQILFTPLAETFRFPVIVGNAVAFHGTGDPWAVTEQIVQICEEKKIPLHLTPGANHSLECGKVKKDLKTIRDTMKKVAEFLEDREC